MNVDREGRHPYNHLQLEVNKLKIEVGNFVERKSARDAGNLVDGSRTKVSVRTSKFIRKAAKEAAEKQE